MTRWHIVVALLHSPERESNRLAALLERLPAEVRKHELSDDCRRRRWTRQNGAGASNGAQAAGNGMGGGGRKDGGPVGMTGRSSSLAQSQPANLFQPRANHACTPV